MPTISKRSITIAASLGGLVLSMAATFCPWTVVPMASEGDPASILMVEPSIDVQFKLGCQIIVLLGFMIISRRISNGNTIATLSAWWLVLLLLYPYAVTVWHPRLSTQAAWLQMQYEDLTGQGGDLGRASEFTAAPWQGPIYPGDGPNRFSTFTLPRQYPSEFEMGGLIDLCRWLGYTEGFCQFSRVGWYLAVSGACLILISSCLAQRPDSRRVIHVIRVVLFAGAAAATSAWALTFAAGWHVRCAENHVRMGQLDEALDQLNRARGLLPILQHDTDFAAQYGWIYDQLGETDRPEARLYRAGRLEREGRLAEARAIYRDLLRHSAPNSPCRREACRAILHDAIHALNSGSTGPALDELYEVLEADPTSLKALYVAQVTTLKQGKLDEVDACGRQLDLLCRCFQHPIRDAVRSAAYQNEFVSALDRGDLTTAIEAYQKAKSP